MLFSPESTKFRTTQFVAFFIGFFFVFLDKKQYPTLSLSNQCQCKWVASSYNMLGLPCYGQMLKEKGKKGDLEMFVCKVLSTLFTRVFRRGRQPAKPAGYFT